MLAIRGFSNSSPFCQPISLGCEAASQPKANAKRAIAALVLYPFIWLMLLPFRIMGIAVHGVLALVWAVVMLPVRLLSAPFRLA